MKKEIYIYSVILILYLLSAGCNKKISPSSTEIKLTDNYDSSAFEYVFTEAIKQKFLGNAGDAIKYLEQCIKINPQSDAAYYEMAQLAMMLSDRKGAKKFALKAATLNDKNFWYLSFVANIYYQEKIPDSAIIFYEKAAKYFPEKDYVKLNLASIYSENKQYEKAAEIYNVLEKKYGASENSALLIIKNLINAGKFKEGEEKTKELLKSAPDNVLYNGLLAEIYQYTGEKTKANEIYYRLLEGKPGDPQILLSLSEFLLTEKQYEDLLPILRKIVLNDSIAPESKISLFSRIVNDSSIIKGHANEVEIILMMLEADSKENDFVLLLRPELLVNEKKTSDAILRLEQMINDKPGNYYAWERLLILYSDTKNWDKLFIRGEECATKFNRSYPAKILYANAAIEKGKLEIASEELRKAKILAGSDTSKLIQVLVMDADVLYRQKDFKKSFEIFKEALKIDPDDAMILNNYAYYLAEQEQELKEAERMAKLVIEKEKGNNTYLDTYAWVLYKRGRFKEAKKIMDQIVEKGEKDAEWFEHLGYILKALRNCDKAVEYWRQAYELDKRKELLLIEIKNCKKQ